MTKEKSKIIDHYSNSIEFVESLSCITENQWRSPIDTGKWSIAEIIGHLVFWDEVVHKRIPHLFSEGVLPKVPDVEAMNSQAAAEARTYEKQMLVNKFVAVRKELIGAIDKMPLTDWCKEFNIGQTRLNLFDYYNGLVKHDTHHFQQIKRVLEL
ncbi:DinB family protein [Paenibacillus sp. N3/727]|uniref:DinB family protein n=1 Tax=Paenibacillus sp. N3/727 TaxID=2925845 RepID=UPI001F5320D2|nr:DinB family protein [Paenibacillus sp. N3/727]UNK17548.1 DinB family protein [Paenibacillus sp. N3/727]